MRIKTGIIAVILAISLPALAYAERLEETFDKTYAIGNGGQIEVTNVNGSIDISSWDRTDVRVHAEKIVEGRSDVAKKAMSRIAIIAEHKGGSLRIKTRTPESDFGFFDWIVGANVNAQVRYEITVPRSANLEIDTVNGKISVSEVTGKIQLGSTNGAIVVVDSAGSLEASTTNGAIRAELRALTGGESLTLRTTNGAIKLALPEELRAEIDASTTNGSVRSDFPVTVYSADRNSLRGTVNGGGAKIRLRTTNGSIQLLKAPAMSASK